MSTIYKYYLNGIEYQPINTGGFTLDITLVREAGSYQYTKELNGSLNFKNAAYEYILLNSECQKITLEIKEFCGEGTFVIWYGYFTVRDCKFMPDKKQVDVYPNQDSLYKCLTDNYDRNFNILEASTVVESIYALDLSKFEYRWELGTPTFTNICDNVPFWPQCFGGDTFPTVAFLAREIVTVYCQGGELQAPAGTGWELFLDNCAAKNLSQWYRTPPRFLTLPLIQMTGTGCGTPACIPPTPPAVGNEDWQPFGEPKEDTVGGITLAYWIDVNTITTTVTDIDNGRPLVDVLNLGLNKSCPELDVQSNFLTQLTNPVTGINPSSTEGIQLHSISDVKDPTATEPATVENITLKDLLDSYISSKLNCFWRVDEGTKRLIIEHYNDLNNQGVTDLTAIQGGKYTRLRNEYEYDNSDVPKAEEFPSLDTTIDFTGVDIVYNNDCSKGVKAYNTSKFYSEVESILNDPDQYPNEGIVAITPDSLAPLASADPSGARSENGAITGDYRPNMPQAMANLQDKFFKFYRPFPEGEMNFINTAFSKLKPVKKLQQLQIPLCCFFFFAPYSKFIGNNFTEGQLQSASFNPATGFMTLNIMY